jgi:hypothetical protein
LPKCGVRQSVTGTSLADYLDDRQDRPEAPEEGERPDGTTRRPPDLQDRAGRPDDDGEGAL